MEKETLLTGFKKVLGEPAANGYFGDTGVTDRTLGAYIDALLPTITSDESVNDAFYASHVGVVKAMGGQMRFEQAEFAKNYKPKGNGGTPPAIPPTEPNGGDTVNKDLLKRLEAIEKERELEKKTSLENGLRDRVINKAGGLNVSNKALWGDVARQVAITEGMDDAKMEEETKRLYEAKLKEYVGEGATPYKSAGAGNDSEEASKSLDAFFANKAQEGKFPAKDKQ